MYTYFIFAVFLFEASRNKGEVCFPLFVILSQAKSVNSFFIHSFIRCLIQLLHFMSHFTCHVCFLFWPCCCVSSKVFQESQQAAKFSAFLSVGLSVCGNLAILSFSLL